MRLRCTKGMSINTFHGNFFVRSTDLLSLPNVNPDHSFGMQIDIEDNLTESSMVGFQAALLYTNTKGGFFVVVVHATNLQTYKNMKNNIFFMLSFKILPCQENSSLF